MKAIIQKDPDKPRSLELSDVDDPELRDGEVLVKVAATAVNRGDLMQTKGMYPPPQGDSEILGLECAGTIADAGNTDRVVGEEVGCLLTGGGYAEYAAVPVGQLTPIPQGFDLVETAGVVEVACTVWSNLGMLAGVQEGDRVLIHGGAGGIGSFAIQLCKALGCEVVATAGSPDKLDYCRDLGADIVINYKEQEFVEELKGSCDVILDIMGGSYLEDNVKCLAVDGRLIVIALQGGAKGTLNLGRMLTRRQSVHATTLRARPRAMKAAIVADTVAHVWPLLESGAISTTVSKTFPLADAASAHDQMDSDNHRGKIILTLEDIAG